MHWFTDRILDVSNSFQNTNVPIHERVCFIPTPYYLEWFEKYYPNIYTNQYHGPFYLQCVNGIQVTNPDGRQCNIMIDAVVEIIK